LYGIARRRSAFLHLRYQSLAARTNKAEGIFYDNIFIAAVG